MTIYNRKEILPDELPFLIDPFQIETTPRRKKKSGRHRKYNCQTDLFDIDEFFYP